MRSTSGSRGRLTCGSTPPAVRSKKGVALAHHDSVRRTRSYETSRASWQREGRARRRPRERHESHCDRDPLSPRVNKSGELGGYGGGLWRKRRLLHLEGNGTK